MRRLLSQLIDPHDGRRPLAPAIGAAVSLALGLIFVFVWAPHPWGWHGIDQYHDLARGLARGEAFATTDVPWGYAYFVAAFYAAFGERAWIPVTAQVFANATIPLMLYALARPIASARVAAIASLLVGALSFNTVYASTETSDAICTVLFIAALLSFLRGDQTGKWTHFAVSGLLSGTVPQFRPNLILFPIVMAVAYAVYARAKPHVVTAIAIFLMMVAVALAPWVVRNYRLTGAVLPTSTHGGVQLWYGTLQVGDYLESRAHNPRSIFEAAPFDYTSVAGESLVITGERPACEGKDDTTVSLVYHTDRDPHLVRLPPVEDAHGRVMFEIPGQPAPTALYYYFETSWTTSAGEIARRLTPVDADVAPLVYFVASEHLTDLDRHGDLLDVFDLIRSIRRLAWQEASMLPAIDLDGNGVVDDADLKEAVVRLIGGRATAEAVLMSPPLTVTAQQATLRLADGSTLSVPRQWPGRVTDLDVRGGLSGSLVPAHRRIRQRREPPSPIESCRVIWDPQVNEVFYRKEPHLMRRYMALAFDNISRDPWVFAAASAYRMARLFVVRGTDDALTTQQFERSGVVYVAGLLVSIVYLIAFLAGVAVVWRARSPALVFLVPIVYVPLTICFVLTNMRYTITVQPLMFIFVAAAIDRVLSSPGDKVLTTQR